MVKKLNEKTILHLKYFSELSSILIAFLGFIMILGWIFNISFLESPGPGFSTVNPKLALCFVLIGISLCLIQTRVINKHKRQIAYFLAVIVILIGILTIIGHIFTPNLYIFQIALKGAPYPFNTLLYNRMEFIAALNISLIGIALLLLDRKVESHNPSQYLGIIVSILSLMAFMGYIYHISNQYVEYNYTETAIYAAILFLLVSSAVLFARPDKGLMRALTGTGIGSAFAWKLIPATIVTSLSLGYFHLLGQQDGFYDTPFETTALIISMIIILLIIIWININFLNKIDYKHRETKEDVIKLANIVNSSEDAIISKDLNSAISSWNRGAEKIYGYSAHEMIGKPLYNLMSSSEWEKFSKLEEKVKKGKSICPYEAKRLKKDSTEMYVSVTLSPIKNYEGKIAGISIIARDISKRKKIEEKLQDTISKLEHSNNELQQFAYITSHDLQEPLRAIASFTQLLEKRYKNRLDPDADEYIDFIVDSAVRMKEMIQGLLYYSRVGTRGGEFQLISSEEVLKDTLLNLEAIINENKAKITYDKLPMITGDKLQLVQLFQNLIENAIKFKKPDIPPKIQISARKDEQRNEYIFNVSDNGIGMEPQYTGKIFEVFKRLHTMDEYNGVGIGLAISKRIIERHGGKMWVESKLGTGSTFYFSIPIRSPKTP
jgi:PAS domain S-box-containing protein